MTKTKLMLTSLLLAGSLNATPATFDASTFTDTLSTAAGTAATVAASIAAISAGIMVWKKVRKYFNQAG